MIVVSKYGMHPKRSFQPRKKRPYRVYLRRCLPFMHVVARADNQITLKTIGSADHMPDDRQWNEKSVVEVGKVHDAEPGERRRQVRHRNSIVIGQNEVPFNKDGVAGQQPRHAENSTCSHELPSGHALIVGFERISHLPV